jgi:hypothetical protein
VARLFLEGDGPIAATANEEVDIGEFKGEFIVDGFAWGSRNNGTRHVLSVFRSDR